MVDYFVKKVIQLGRLKRQATRAKSQKENIMEKTTLLKIIRAVRELEIKMSKNDSQFEFYSKKKKAIDYKNKQIQNKMHKLIWSEHKKGTITEKIKELNKKRKECKKLTINQDNYKYMYMRQD